MLRLEKVDWGYYRVFGYADGSDWLLAPGRTSIRFHGIAGDYAWFYDDGNDLKLFNARDRRETACLSIGKREGWTDGTRVSASRDGRRLYALESKGETQTLHIVDPVRGSIVASHDGFPPAWREVAVERADGKLLIPITHYHDPGPYLQGLVLFDPADGTREESLLPDPNRLGFLSHSADGHRWLRPERGVLPVHDVAPALTGRVFGRRPERHYGLTLQLWEGFPLRFVRRITVAWLRPGELPNEGSLTEAEHNALWRAIAETSARVDAGPTDAVPRAAFPAPFSTDDKSWQRIEENWRVLAQRWARGFFWQPDGEAVWVETNGFLSCVGLDGTVSPRLCTERKGMRGDTWLPCAVTPRDVTPGNGRQARVAYEDGTATFDGAASDAPWRPLRIGKAQDRWVAVDPTAQGQAARAMAQRVEAHKSGRKKGIVPLAAWSEAACVAAIDALADRLGKSFYARAVDGDIQTVFAIDGDEVDEPRFFARVRNSFPGVAPAIRRLIARYCETAPNRDLFWSGGEGIGIFGHAVQALGVLDESALPLLCEYGYRVDTGHEHFFSRETVTAVIRAHGWSDAVIDFVVWVILRNFYNSLQDNDEIWRAWGLGQAAMRRYTPDAFARRVAEAAYAVEERRNDPGRYITGGLDRLVDELKPPHDPWVAAFIAALPQTEV